MEHGEESYELTKHDLMSTSSRFTLQSTMKAEIQSGRMYIFRHEEDKASNKISYLQTLTT